MLGRIEFELDGTGKRVYRTDRELEALASEVVLRPEALTADLVTWLCSDNDAGRAYQFWWCLGKADVERKWLPKIEEVGARQNGAIGFSAYFGGQSRVDSAFVANRLEELTGASQVTGEAIARATSYLNGDLAGIKRMEVLISGHRVDPVFVGHVLMHGRWIDSLTSDEFLRLLKAIAGPGLENGATVIDCFGMWLHSGKPIQGQLAEFAWQCLESAPPIGANVDYYCDQLASNLAALDTGRGFRLLEGLLSKAFDIACWNPIDCPGSKEFWNALHKADREHALRVVLYPCLGDPRRRYRVMEDFPEVVDQVNDADALLTIALENEASAQVVAESITASRPGFWPIALGIIQAYPDSAAVRGALAGAIQRPESLMWGPWSKHLKTCLNDINRVLGDAETTMVARSWLEQVQSAFRAQLDRELVSEADEDAND